MPCAGNDCRRKIGAGAWCGCHGAGNQPPVADPQGPYTGLSDDPVQFDASASWDPDGAIVCYDWDFGDGAIAPDAGPTPSHTYLAPGQYVAALTVTDDGGLTDTGVATGSIDPPQNAGLDLDMVKFKVNPLTVNVNNATAIKISLWIENPGTVAGEAPATVIGTQDGNLVFAETLTVSPWPWAATIASRANT